jgi:acetolactate synthase-1/2/3 large subunit
VKVYEAIPELIGRIGSPVVFGLVGSANVGWVGHGVAAGTFTWVGVRHEGTAVAAATAFSRATRGVAIASTTMGPGFANTVNSLAAALHDHAQVVLFVGQSPSSKRGGDFQTLKQREICHALGVGFHEARQAPELEEAFWDAIEACRWNGTPQVISVDEAVLEHEVRLTEKSAPAPGELSEPDPDAVAAVVDMLAAAKKPLILAGRGAELSDARDGLLELADLTGAVVANTLAVNRFFAGHPRDMGVCGKSSSPAAVEAFQDVDAVLAVGASLNSFTTSSGGIFPRARVAQLEVDFDAKFRASSTELALFGDANRSIAAVIDEWRQRGVDTPPGRTHVVPTWKQMRDSVLRVDLGRDPSRGLDPREVLAEFDDRLPEDRIVVTDGGRAGIPIPALLNARDHYSWLTSRGYGSIGLGLPAAIGAAQAFPDRPVVLFCGDGGFMMSANELDTARHHGLSITVVILNDSQYGSERKYLTKLGLDPYVAQQELPDIPLLAQSFGGTGVVVRTDDELRRVDGTRAGIYLIDVRVDPEVDPANI